MMQPDDPPFLSVGTEVSAKYKGAFCEAKVHKVVKCVKIKVTFKGGLGSHVVSDEQVKGVLKVGSTVKAAHPDKANTQEAVIAKIQDCSQYTVVFDDGDITTLRRSSLCLKSGRHFAESESLDQLPLTHPEHFGSPVVGGGAPGRRGVARRHKGTSSRLGGGGASGSECSDSSVEEADVHKTHRSRRDEWEHDISKVVCVEACDKKKQRDNWFPGLVVAPTAQDTVRIDTRKDWLVRSFQDGRYYTVPKKEATVFTKEVGAKATLGSLKAAVDKAMEYLTTDVLPPHWDRDLLFGMDISEQDTDGTESDESDDEPREEKDHFVAQLYKFMEECGTPINKGPTIANRDLDLYKLFRAVQKLGGFNRVLNQNQLKVVAHKMNLSSLGSQGPTLIKAAYKRYLHNFEDFYRKLGCTMVSSPRRASRPRPRSGGRSLIRDCDRVDKSPHGAGSSASGGGGSCSPSRGRVSPAVGGTDSSAPETVGERTSDVTSTGSHPSGSSRGSANCRAGGRGGGVVGTKRSGGRKEEVEEEDTTAALTVAKDVRTYSRVTRQDTVSRSPDRPTTPRRHSPSPCRAPPTRESRPRSAQGDVPSTTASRHGLSGRGSSTSTRSDTPTAPSTTLNSNSKSSSSSNTSPNNVNSSAGNGSENINSRSVRSTRADAEGTATAGGAANGLAGGGAGDVGGSDVRTRSSSGRGLSCAVLNNSHNNSRKELANMIVKEDSESEEDDEDSVVVASDRGAVKVTRTRSSKHREESREKSAPPTTSIPPNSLHPNTRKASSTQSSNPSLSPTSTTTIAAPSARRKLLQGPSFACSSLDLDNDSDSQDNESCHSSASGGGGGGEGFRAKRRGVGRGFGRGGRGLTRGGCGSGHRSSVGDDADGKAAKKGRKKRLEGESIMDNEGHVCVNAGLPSHVPISIGDRLLVVYGQPEEIQSCVTYEAKVIDISNDLILCNDENCSSNNTENSSSIHSNEAYYVHYPGWNTRYDEWVSRCSIARNLSFTPNTRIRNNSTGGAGTTAAPVAPPGAKKEAIANNNPPQPLVVSVGPKSTCSQPSNLNTSFNPGVASVPPSASSSNGVSSSSSGSSASNGSTRRGPSSRASSNSSTRSSKEALEDFAAGVGTRSKASGGDSRHSSLLPEGESDKSNSAGIRGRDSCRRRSARKNMIPAASNADDGDCDTDSDSDVPESILVNERSRGNGRRGYDSRRTTGRQHSTTPEPPPTSTITRDRRARDQVAASPVGVKGEATAVKIGTDGGPEFTKVTIKQECLDDEDDVSIKDDVEEGTFEREVERKTRDQHSCGKDIDLKAIESEMKGLDRPIKKEEDLIGGGAASALHAYDGPRLQRLNQQKKQQAEAYTNKKVGESPAKRNEALATCASPGDRAGSALTPTKSDCFEDDIYEFKEPEPFEIGEMRSRKEGRGSRGSLASPQDDSSETEGRLTKKKMAKGGRDSEAEALDSSDSDVMLTPKKIVWDKETKLVTPQKRETPVKKELDEMAKKEARGEVTPAKLEVKCDLAASLLAPTQTPSPAAAAAASATTGSGLPNVAAVSPDNSTASPSIKPALVSEIPAAVKDPVLRAQPPGGPNHQNGSGPSPSPCSAQKKSLQQRKENLLSKSAIRDIKVVKLDMNAAGSPLSKLSQGEVVGKVTSIARPKLDLNAVANTNNNIAQSNPFRVIGGVSSHIMAQVLPPKQSRALAKPLAAKEATQSRQNAVPGDPGGGAKRLTQQTHPLLLSSCLSTAANSNIGSPNAPPQSSLGNAPPVSPPNLNTGEEKIDPKAMPFGRRKQHIFPHLLSRPNMETNSNSESGAKPVLPGVILGTNNHQIGRSVALSKVPLTVPPQHISPHAPATLLSNSPTPRQQDNISLPVDKDNGSDNEESDEDDAGISPSLTQMSVGESIESVIQKARQRPQNVPSFDNSLEEPSDGDNTKTFDYKKKRLIGRGKKKDISSCSAEGELTSPAKNKRLRVKDNNVIRSPRREMGKKLVGKRKEDEFFDGEDSLSTEEGYAKSSGTEITPTRSSLRKKPRSSATPKRLEIPQITPETGDEQQDNEDDEEMDNETTRITESALTCDDTDANEAEIGVGELLCEETIPPGSPVTQDQTASEAEQICLAAEAAQYRSLLSPYSKQQQQHPSMLASVPLMAGGPIQQQPLGLHSHGFMRHEAVEGEEGAYHHGSMSPVQQYGVNAGGGSPSSMMGRWGEAAAPYQDPHSGVGMGGGQLHLVGSPTMFAAHPSSVLQNFPTTNSNNHLLTDREATPTTNSHAAANSRAIGILNDSKAGDSDTNSTVTPNSAASGNKGSKGTVARGGGDGNASTSSAGGSGRTVDGGGSSSGTGGGSSSSNNNRTPSNTGVSSNTSCGVEVCISGRSIVVARTEPPQPVTNSPPTSPESLSSIDSDSPAIRDAEAAKEVDESSRSSQSSGSSSSKSIMETSEQDTLDQFPRDHLTDTEDNNTMDSSTSGGTATTHAASNSSRTASSASRTAPPANLASSEPASVGTRGRRKSVAKKLISKTASILSVVGLRGSNIINNNANNINISRQPDVSMGSPNTSSSTMSGGGAASTSSQSAAANSNGTTDPAATNNASRAYDHPVPGDGNVAGPSSGRGSAGTSVNPSSSGMVSRRQKRLARMAPRPVEEDNEDSNHSRPSTSSGGGRRGAGRGGVASATGKRKKKTSIRSHPYRQYRNDLITEGGPNRSLDGTFAGNEPPLGRFNFLQSIDHLGLEQRIDEITRRITDLRKVYAECKTSAASMERKKKKIRKRDKENKAEDGS